MAAWREEGCASGAPHLPHCRGSDIAAAMPCSSAALSSAPVEARRSACRTARSEEWTTKKVPTCRLPIRRSAKAASEPTASRSETACKPSSWPSSEWSNASAGAARA